MTEEVLRAVEEAIEDEKNAQKRYREAAERAQEPEVRLFFEQLLRDEEEHERLLRDRLKTLRLMKEF